MRLRTLTSLLVFHSFLALGCKDEKTAHVIDPVYGDPCEFQECGLGMCHAKSATEPECLCPVGYAGKSCEACDSDYHRDSLQRCVSDKHCADQPAELCGLGGTCATVDGVVSCMCDDGYVGPRCELCADRYSRDDLGRCLPLFIMAGPPAPVITARDAGMSCERGYHGAACVDCSPGYHKQSGACVLDEICRVPSCPPNADCDIAAGVVDCTCQAGYAGASCQFCAESFHRDNDRCVADETCASDTCGAHATCKVVKGFATCSCEVGYQGESCDACAAGYVKSAEKCVIDTGGCQPGQHREAGDCVTDQWCERDSCPEHATCKAVAGKITCPCDPGWSPEGTCAQCTGYATERSGFEFASGWPAAANTCFERGDLAVSLVTFASRVGPEKREGPVMLCAASTYSPMTSQHIELESYPGLPATLVFERAANNVVFDAGARIEPVAIDIYAHDLPTADMSMGGRRVATVDLSAKTRTTVTVALNPLARALSLRSRNGKLQSIALDDVVYSYPACD